LIERSTRLIRYCSFGGHIGSLDGRFDQRIGRARRGAGRHDLRPHAFSLPVGTKYAIKAVPLLLARREEMLESLPQKIRAPRVARCDQPGSVLALAQADCKGGIAQCTDKA